MSNTLNSVTVPVNLSLITVVMATYYCCRIAHYSILNCLIASFLPCTSSGLILMTLIATVVFAVAESSALVPIYFFKIKPNAVPLLDFFNIRFDKTQSWRTLRLSMITLLITMVSYVFARFLEILIGFSAHTNPIMSLLAAVKKDQNYPALFVMVLLMCALAPLAEEALVRGFLFKSLRQKVNFTSASIISAMYFDAMHFESASISLFFFGIIYAWSAERSKSIVPPVIAHGAWNLWCVFWA